MSTCGVGGWGGPLPGDPSNDAVLSAVGVFGGIDVSWSYPTTNPWAVAYVRVFRGVSSDISSAVEVGKVGGNFFHDRLAAASTCYYWIQIVSINGTILAVVGPAWALSKLSITEVIEQLTGQIDASLLAAALRAPIDRIPLIEYDLADEITNRLADNVSLQAVLAGVATDIGGVNTLLSSEISVRTTQNSAVIIALDAMAVSVSGNTAAIVGESITRADAVSALASRVDILYAAGAGGDFMAAIEVERLARVDADEAVTSFLTNQISTGRGEVNAALAAAISTEQTTRATAVDAVASSVTSLQATLNTKIGVDIGAAINSEQVVRVAAEVALGVRIDTTQASIVTQGETLTGLVQTETTARVDADGALASQITTAQSTLNGSIASVQTTLETSIDIVDGKATAIGARYTAVVDVNGLIGGFGIYNTGTQVDAGFDVDTFWVGRTTNKMKPFIISGGVVYIAEAAIPILSAGKIDTTGMVIRNAGGQIIFGAGATVDPSVYMSVPAGWLNTNAVATAAADATAKADAAQVAAAAYTVAQRSLAEITAGAYADGIVSVEETRAIADATNKANAAQAAAIAAAALDATAKADAAEAAAIASAGVSLSTKLNKAGTDTLSGLLTLDAATVSGLRVGNLLWDVAGARTSGYGVAVTPFGLVGYNPAGDITFGLSAATGNLVVKGDISGSTINSVGGLSVNGRTWSTGNGVWLGMDAGFAKLFIGNADQYLRYSSETGNLEQKFLPFSATVNPSSIDELMSGAGASFVLYTSPSIDLTLSGGLAPFVYTWTLEHFAPGDGSNNFTIHSGQGTASVVLRASMPKIAVLSATLTCNIRDANGRVTSSEVSVVVERL